MFTNRMYNVLKSRPWLLLISLKILHESLMANENENTVLTSNGNSSKLNLNQCNENNSSPLHHMGAYIHISCCSVKTDFPCFNFMPVNPHSLSCYSYWFINTILIIQVCISINLHWQHTHTHTNNFMSEHFGSKFNPIKPTPVRLRWVTYLYAVLVQSAMKAFPFVINCSLSEEQS